MQPSMQSRTGLDWLRVCGFVFGACLVYALSSGPVWRAFGERAGHLYFIPKWVDAVYWPLDRTLQIMPNQIQAAYMRYMDYWRSRMRPYDAGSLLRQLSDTNRPNQHLQATPR